MDEVFTSPQSGYEGATPIMMPSSLQEILKWERTPHKSEGGELDDEHPDQFRELNKLGLYSKAAEVAQDATGQNATKTPAEWHKYLLNRNVKPDELKWSHFDNAFQPDEKVHKDDLAAHFNYNNQEPYTEQVYKDEGHDYENNEDGIGQLALDMEQDHDLFKKVLPQKHLQEHAKRKKAEGEDVADWLVDEWSHSLQDYIQKQKNSEGQFPTRHSQYQMLGPSENYREIVLQHDPEGHEKFREAAHHPNAINPLLHIRMSDRKGLNGEKLLHIEELQSDWGQQGADFGFNEKQKKAKEEKWRDLDRQFHEFDFVTRNKIEKELRNRKWPNATPFSEKEIERITLNSHLRDIIRDYGSSEDLENYNNLRDKSQKAFREYHAPMVEEGPHVGDTNTWTDLGLKRILKEAADGGYHGITFAPGKTQAARWSTPGLEKPYDVTIPSRMQKLINRHDDSLKFQPYSTLISFHGVNEPYKAHYLPMSEKAATSIKEGQERFRRGGEVNKSVAQSPKMIHNPPIIGHALNKIRSLPQDSGQPLSGKQGRLF